MAAPKTVIVTGASQGIGAAIVQAFFWIAATTLLQPRAAFPRPASRHHRTSIIDGDIGQATTAETVAKTAIDSREGVLFLFANLTGAWEKKASNASA